MMKILILLITVLAVALIACEYQPPPGGVEAYCWRVEARAPVQGSSMVFYTNTKPTETDGVVWVSDAWLTWNELGGPTSRPSRFDRHINVIGLPRTAFESVAVRQMDWCPLDKGE